MPYSAERLCDEIGQGASVPENIPLADWADDKFILSSESSNTAGKWRTAPDQRAILNSFGSDAIEKVDFFKPTRYGGTKMAIAATFYFLAHKRRNLCFYQPSNSDSDEFVKTEIQPQIRDCPDVLDKMIDPTEKSSSNTLSYKAFEGCSAYFKGAHSPKNFERMTLDVVLLDELDQCSGDVGKKGDPTTLSWGRVRNSLFKKQIQISKPTIKDFSLIEKSANAAEDRLVYQVQCPECEIFTPLEWGGKDEAFGFKWKGDDASSVLHHCKECGAGWGNDKLTDAMEPGFWLGENGFKTKDGLSWERHGEPCMPPRHIAFLSWSGYSSFVTWEQLVNEWHDAQGDIEKIQAYTNNALAKAWDIQHQGGPIEQTVGKIILTDDLSNVVAVTAGADVQDDRLEIQYVGHDRDRNIYILGYEIYRGDPGLPEVWMELGRDVIGARFKCGERELPVYNAGVDTQGHHTGTVHEFLKQNQKRGVFIGLNGTANIYEIADKPSSSKSGEGGDFFSIGTNVHKQRIMSSIRNHDAQAGGFRIWSGAKLPEDYAKQLGAEKMEVSSAGGKEKIVFTNKHKKRNEALDTLVYAMAMRAYIAKHRGRQGRMLLGS